TIPPGASLDSQCDWKTDTFAGFFVANADGGAVKLTDGQDHPLLLTAVLADRGGAKALPPRPGISPDAKLPCGPLSTAELRHGDEAAAAPGAIPRAARRGARTAPRAHALGAPGRARHDRPRQLGPRPHPRQDRRRRGVRHGVRAGRGRL